ncbi:MAG: hypothetical protein SOW59_06355 [Corynebacterium sp.]|nr:hypothetical protein [Corynebacterium sp.]
MTYGSRNTYSQDDSTQSKYDNPRLPLQRALRLGAGALFLATIVSLALWGAVRGLPGIWGVLLGAGIGGGFVLVTAASVLFTSKASPATTMAVVLGGWLVKIVLLIAVLLAIRNLDFYDTVALLVTIVLALIAVLGSEVWGIVTTKVTYVN